MVTGIALDVANIDCIVYHAAAAARLTRMLADIAANGWERIILADQAHRVVAASSAYKRNIAGNVDTSRAKCHTRHRLVQTEQAAAVFNMGDIILPEALYALQHHARSFIADCAISGIQNDTCGLFDQVDGVDRCSRIQNVFQQCSQLTEADAAWDTFAAGLCMAKAQKRQRHIHRAQPRRTGTDAAFDIAI